METRRADDVLDAEFYYEHHFPGIFISTHTARKQHECRGHRDCVIQPGEEYVDVIYSAWLVTTDDPDVPPAPAGSFLHAKQHRYSTDHNTAGKRN